MNTTIENLREEESVKKFLSFPNYGDRRSIFEETFKDKTEQEKNLIKGIEFDHMVERCNQLEKEIKEEEKSNKITSKFGVYSMKSTLVQVKEDIVLFSKDKILRSQYETYKSNEQSKKAQTEKEVQSENDKKYEEHLQTVLEDLKGTKVKFTVNNGETISQKEIDEYLESLKKYESMKDIDKYNSMSAEEIGKEFDLNGTLITMVLSKDKYKEILAENLKTALLADLAKASTEDVYEYVSNKIVETKEFKDFIEDSYNSCIKMVEVIKEKVALIKKEETKVKEDIMNKSYLEALEAFKTHLSNIKNDNFIPIDLNELKNISEDNKKAAKEFFNATQIDKNKYINMPIDELVKLSKIELAAVILLISKEDGREMFNNITKPGFITSIVKHVTTKLSDDEYAAIYNKLSKLSEYKDLMNKSYEYVSNQFEEIRKIILEAPVSNSPKTIQEKNKELEEQIKENNKLVFPVTFDSNIAVDEKGNVINQEPTPQEHPAQKEQQEIKPTPAPVASTKFDNTKILEKYSKYPLVDKIYKAIINVPDVDTQISESHGVLHFTSYLRDDVQLPQFYLDVTGKLIDDKAKVIVPAYGVDYVEDGFIFDANNIELILKHVTQQPSPITPEEYSIFEMIPDDIKSFNKKVDLTTFPMEIEGGSEDRNKYLVALHFLIKEQLDECIIKDPKARFRVENYQDRYTFDLVSDSTVRKSLLQAPVVRKNQTIKVLNQEATIVEEEDKKSKTKSKK